MKAELLSWLTYEGFLTERLKALRGNAQLTVLNEQWLLSPSVWCREILMSADNHPCWYARTLIPEVTQRENIALFDRLQHEPLGNLIFYGTDIQRISLTHYSITPNSKEYQWLQPEWHQNSQLLWMRSSEFKVKHPKHTHSFFLMEILLPFLVFSV